MLEYIFFDDSLRNRFIRFAREQGLECQCRADGLGIIAAIADDLPENISDKLEAYYDKLMDEQSDLIDQAEGGLEKHVASIRFTLPDGRSCMVKLAPSLANRLLSHFTMDEVQILFAAVADSVEHPASGPLCKP